jgi:Imidazolonepropionase and related amidohydrolases
MATTLIENIGQILHINTQNARVLCKSQMREFPRTEKAWLLVEDDRIADWGQENPPPAEQKVDAGGGLVLPTFVDSHTHLVYAGTREDEFAQRLAGLTYSEIAARGGGILNSARKLRESSFEALYLSAAQRLEELIAMGTGALEIKSGYGLSTDSERKMLQVARQLGKDFPLPIKTSFLGAHALPPEYANRREDYVKLLSEEMLPALVEEGLVDYLDVFCERGYFDLEETLYLVRQASDLGLKSKLHVNQFNSFGAVPALVAEGVLSLDHLEVMEEADCAALAKSQTIGTLLPGCSCSGDPC